MHIVIYTTAISISITAGYMERLFIKPWIVLAAPLRQPDHSALISTFVIGEIPEELNG
jgi:hypothetical protein